MTDTRNPTLIALLASVLEFPEDDGPRLVFADWLDENGQPERAELLRVQCDIAAARRAKGLPENARELPDGVMVLIDRESDLLDSIRSPLVTDGIGSAMLAYRRGLLETVECTAEAWIAGGDHIVANEWPTFGVRLTYPLDWSTIILSNPINTEPRPLMRLPGRKQWVPISAGFPSGAMAWMRMLFHAEWPSVKTWHLPTQSTPFDFDTAALELEYMRQALAGDPSAPTPRGVINYRSRR